MAEVLDALADRLGRDAENIVLADSMDSTHAAALRMIAQIESEGFEIVPTVLVARRQTSGTGREGREWTSPEGGLYVSWLRSGLDRAVVARLPMLAAAAAHQSISALGLAGLGIKWPNDLVVAGAKLGGILVHARHGQSSFCTVGLGVNLVTTPEVPDIAVTSLAEQLGAKTWSEWAVPIVAGFVSALSRALDSPEPAIELWRRHLVHRKGESLSVRLGGGRFVSGTFLGVTGDGFLRLRTLRGEETISSGDVVEGSGEPASHPLPQG